MIDATNKASLPSPTRRDLMRTPRAVKFGMLDDFSPLHANECVEGQTEARPVKWTWSK